MIVDTKDAIMYHYSVGGGPSVVVHTYNSSYSGGRGRVGWFKASLSKDSETLSQKKQNTNKRLEEWL
jgi:hypothetical protein